VPTFQASFDMAIIKGAYHLNREGKLVKKAGVARNYAAKRRQRSKKPKAVSRAKAVWAMMIRPLEKLAR
jgi:hypothetical protein